MTFANTWLNDDGLKVPFGTSDGVQSAGGSVHTKGMTKELRLDLDSSDLPVIGTAVKLDNMGIPAGASILTAALHTSESFSGAITVGLMDAAGATLDADGLIISGTPLVDTVTVGTGTSLETVALVDSYVSVAGTVTSGAGMLVVEYTI